MSISCNLALKILKMSEFKFRIYLSNKNLPNKKISQIQWGERKK